MLLQKQHCAVHYEVGNQLVSCPDPLSVNETRNRCEYIYYTAYVYTSCSCGNCTVPVHGVMLASFPGRSHHQYFIASSVNTGGGNSLGTRLV